MKGVCDLEMGVEAFLHCPTGFMSTLSLVRTTATRSLRCRETDAYSRWSISLGWS